jgi:hypothetical protein
MNVAGAPWLSAGGRRADRLPGMAEVPTGSGRLQGEAELTANLCGYRGPAGPSQLANGPFENLAEPEHFVTQALDLIMAVDRLRPAPLSNEIVSRLPVLVEFRAVLWGPVAGLSPAQLVVVAVQRTRARFSLRALYPGEELSSAERGDAAGDALGDGPRRHQRSIVIVIVIVKRERVLRQLLGGEAKEISQGVRVTYGKYGGVSTTTYLDTEVGDGRRHVVRRPVLRARVRRCGRMAHGLPPLFTCLPGTQPLPGSLETGSRHPVLAPFELIVHETDLGTERPLLPDAQYSDTHDWVIPMLAVRPSTPDPQFGDVLRHPEILPEVPIQRAMSRKQGARAGPAPSPSRDRL